MERTKRMVESLVENITQWEGIDAVTAMPSLADDSYDPYFFISIDIYYANEILDFEMRRERFPDAVAYESSRAHFKDRFLLKDIPVRLEYKQIKQYLDLVENFSEHERRFRSSGTYGLYRIENGSVQYDPNGSFAELREITVKRSNEFWRFLYSIFRNTAVHFLGDLQSAALKDDHYFFLFSSSGFLHNFIRLLFTLNKRFECSGRQAHTEVYTLKILPENFRGRFETFLRSDGGISLERKAEVAELLTTSVLGMEYILD